MFFPDINESLTKSDEIISKVQSGKVYKFDFVNQRYEINDGKLIEITKIEAIKQYVKWILKTSPNKFRIYNPSFGINYNFIGQKNLDLGFISSELKRQISEQLKLHPFIKDIDNFSVSRADNSLNISFEVIANSGELVDLDERLVIK